MLEEAVSILTVTAKIATPITSIRPLRVRALVSRKSLAKQRPIPSIPMLASKVVFLPGYAAPWYAPFAPG